MTDKKLIKGFPFDSYKKESFSAEQMVEKSAHFFEWMDKRRTCRDFSDKPIPKEVIDNIILAASTAPSGAHTRQRDSGEPLTTTPAISGRWGWTSLF